MRTVIDVPKSREDALAFYATSIEPYQPGRAQLIRWGLLVPQAFRKPEPIPPRPVPSRLYLVQERWEEIEKAKRESKYALPQ